MGTGRSAGLARRAPEEPRPLLTGDSPGHTHRLPRGLLVLLIIICTGLAVSIALASVQTARAQREATDTHRRLDALEQFITQRGIERDQQNDSLNQRMTAVVCDLLDGLPAGALLDPKRQEYGCGPGVAPEALTPEARADLQRYATTVPLTTSDGYRDYEDNFAKPDPRYSAGTPRVAAPTPAPAAPAVPSQPPTEAAPTIATPTAPVVPTTDTPVLPYITPGPIVTSLCERLGTCLGGLLDGTNPLDRLGTGSGNR